MFCLVGSTPTAVSFFRVLFPSLTVLVNGPYTVRVSRMNLSSAFMRDIDASTSYEMPVRLLLKNGQAYFLAKDKNLFDVAHVIL